MAGEDKYKIKNFNTGNVKRIDLRPEEQIGEPKDWQWWITTNDYLSEKRGWQQRRIAVLDCNDYMDIFPIEVNELEDDFIQDPVDVISFFCDCHDRSIYPPPWVMNDLYERFSSYFDDNLKGKARGLGEYFGEPKNGNRRSTFRMLATCDAMLDACRSIDRLVNWFSRPLNRALDIVAIYLEQQQALLPKDWHGERNKGREALRVAYQEWNRKKKTTDKYFPKKSATPTTEARLALLKKLGHDSLINNLDLQDLLKQGTKK